MDIILLLNPRQREAFQRPVNGTSADEEFMGILQGRGHPEGQGYELGVTHREYARVSQIGKDWRSPVSPQAQALMHAETIF